MTHRELCIKAGNYLRTKGIVGFHKCKYSVIELERIRESPDAFGWGLGVTQLIEVKISRSDFLSDKNKYWRKHPQYGLGRFRSYLCPHGLISPSELPDNWGLLYADDNGRITVIIKPSEIESNAKEEIDLITGIMRREGIKPQTFSYKKYRDV